MNEYSLWDASFDDLTVKIDSAFRLKLYAEKHTKWKKICVYFHTLVERTPLTQLHVIKTSLAQFKINFGVMSSLTNKSIILSLVHTGICTGFRFVGSIFRLPLW